LLAKPPARIIEVNARDTFGPSSSKIPPFWKHFLSPKPWPLPLVYVSGFFELLGGVGLAVPRMRRAAGWGLIALLVAVFPANVDMLMNAGQFPAIPVWALVARLPLQGVLIAWVWWAAVKSQ